jgi:hypothetical protein
LSDDITKLSTIIQTIDLPNVLSIDRSQCGTIYDATVILSLGRTFIVTFNISYYSSIDGAYTLSQQCTNFDSKYASIMATYLATFDTSHIMRSFEGSYHDAVFSTYSSAIACPFVSSQR